MTQQTAFQVFIQTGKPLRLSPLTERAWCQEAIRRFGPDAAHWTFECPSCGHTQTVQDFLRLGLSGDLAHQECIGRQWNDSKIRPLGHTPGPCNYTAAGFIRLNPQPVVLEDGETLNVFAFARTPIEELLLTNGLTEADFPDLLQLHPKTH